MTGILSKIVTSWPISRSAIATAKPARPPPAIRMRNGEASMGMLWLFVKLSIDVVRLGM